MERAGKMGRAGFAVWRHIESGTEVLPKAASSQKRDSQDQGMAAGCILTVLESPKCEFQSITPGAWRSSGFTSLVWKATTGKPDAGTRVYFLRS